MAKTQKLKFDPDKWEKALKKLRNGLAATRGNTVDDVDDLPDLLPLDRTVAIFYGVSKKSRAVDDLSWRLSYRGTKRLPESGLRTNASAPTRSG